MVVKRTGLWTELMGGHTGVERLWGEDWVVCHRPCAWRPPTDVYENEDGLVVRVEMAGMRGEDFSVTLAGQVLVLAGERVDRTSRRAFHQMEIHFGEFRAEVQLPWEAELDEVEASYEDGFLEVRLPRPRARRVSVVEADRGEN